jgi:hypothetical protein
MLRWIAIVAVVLSAGKPLVAASMNENVAAITNQQKKDNKVGAQPLRFRRRRILKVENSPIFKDDALNFIETSSQRKLGYLNKRSDLSSRPISRRHAVDIDFFWSRLLQSDMSMSMPTPTTTDAPLASPSLSPIIDETDEPSTGAPSVPVTDVPSVPTTDLPSAPTTVAPSDMETDTPTKAPSKTSECDPLNRTNAIRALLEDITDLPDGNVPLDSPQGMAFDWITNIDNATDPCTDAESTVTRFALATLYYSTNGESWTDSTNWISSSVSHCTWYGITCDDNGDVDAFQLGTYFYYVKCYICVFYHSSIS